MAEPITLQKLTDASLNADSLDDLVNGDEDMQVITRTGESYPSAQKALKAMFASGGLPATVFFSYQLMIESNLAEGAYALVVYDTDLTKNGYYRKSAGVHYFLRWNPTAQARELVNKPVLYFKGAITTSLKNQTISYPDGLAIKDGINFKSFAATTLPYGASGTTVLHYYDFADSLIKTTSGSKAGLPQGGDTTLLSASYQGQITSTFNISDDSQPALSKLQAALYDPLHSVNIKLIGDSITWGVGSSNTSEPNPREHALSDPRNNLTNGSWANLLRDWLGKSYLSDYTFVPEPLPSGEPSGSGYYFKKYYLNLRNAKNNIKFIHPTTGATITPVITDNASPKFGNMANMQVNASNPSAYNYNAWVEFEFIGERFGVRYAGQGAGTNTIVDVFVDNVKIGEFNYSTPPQYGLESLFDVAHGKHKVSLRNRSTDGGNFRLETLIVIKKIRVANDGISGTWSKEWLPTGSLFQAIKPTDEFVFVMLGTNDRAQVEQPKSPERLKANLKIIADNIIAQGKNLILMSANAALTAQEDAAIYFFGQADVSSANKQLSDELNIDFIDNYQATVQAKIDGVAYTNDGLHPNDLGHKMIFENIKQAILTA